MTNSELLYQIRELSHDRSLPESLIYTFINMTIQAIEDYGEFNYQYIRDENVVVPKGSKQIITQYPIKKILKIDGLPSNQGVYLNQGVIELENSVNEDTNLKITYLRKHPYYDGSILNRLILDDWVLIYGAVFFALMHNEDPAASVYQSMFANRLSKYYQENKFIVPLDENTVFGVIEGFGV